MLHLSMKYFDKHIHLFFNQTKKENKTKVWLNWCHSHASYNSGHQLQLGTMLPLWFLLSRELPATFP